MITTGIESWIGFALIEGAAAMPVVYALRPSRPTSRWMEATLLGALLGLPILILCAHPLFLAGVPANKAGLLASYAFEWIVCAALRRCMPPPAHSSNPFSPGLRLLLYFILLSLAALLITFHPLTKPYYDSLYYWTIKGWTFANSGDARIFQVMAGPAYPLAVPLGHAVFMIMDNPVGVVCWQRAFFLGSLFYSIVYLGRGHGVAGVLAGILLIPALVMTCERGGEGLGLYADTTLAAGLLLSGVLLMEVLDGRRERVWPAATALAFFALTKVNSAAYLPIVLIAFCAALPSSPWRGSSRARRFGLAAMIFAPAVLAMLAWKVFLWANDVPSRTEGIAGSVLREDILGSSSPLAVYAHKLAVSFRHFSAMFAMDRPWSAEFFARLGWVAVIPALSLCAWRGLAPRERFVALAASGLFGFIIGVMYCFVSASDDAEAAWWFRTGYFRAAVHILPLAALSAALIFARMSGSFLTRRAASAPATPALAARAKTRLRVASLLPLILLAVILFREKGDSNWREVLASYLTPGEGSLKGDRYGFYEPENWSGARVRWASDDAAFTFLKRGGLVRIGYHLSHPDLSSNKPVEVMIEVDGLPPVTTIHEKPGFFEKQFNLLDVPGPYLSFRIKTSRVWKSPDGRQLGAALYPFRWEEPTETK